MGKKKENSVNGGGKSKLLRPAVIAIILVGGLSIGLAASLGISKVSGSADQDLKKEANSGGYGKFPSYVTSSPTPNAKIGYQAAVDHTEHLDQVPCFCGCGKHSGHKSVRYCFIEQRKGESILFDRHGAGCKMCVDIAIAVAEGMDDGTPLKEIRAQIEEQYADSLDSMTPTPPIEG